MKVVNIELTQEQYDNMLKVKELLASYVYPNGNEVGEAIEQAFDNHVALIEVIEKGKK